MYTPFFTISAKDSPIINVFDELEFLVEWAVNNVVLIPAALSVFLCIFSQVV